MSEDEMESAAKQTFEFETLIVHVRNVNPRTEKHGDKEKLAVDVSCRLMMGDVGDEWDEVLELLFGEGQPGDPTPDDLLEGIKSCMSKVTFAAEYLNYRVGFCHIAGSDMGLDEITFLGFAGIDKFTMDFDDIGIVFRIQALADGATIGKLSELINHKVRLVTVKTEAPPDEKPPETQTSIEIPKQVTKG